MVIFVLLKFIFYIYSTYLILTECEVCTISYGLVLFSIRSWAVIEEKQIKSRSSKQSLDEANGWHVWKKLYWVVNNLEQCYKIFLWWDRTKWFKIQFTSFNNCQIYYEEKCLFLNNKNKQTCMGRNLQQFMTGFFFHSGKVNWSVLVLNKRCQSK